MQKWASFPAGRLAIQKVPTRYNRPFAPSPDAYGAACFAPATIPMVAVGDACWLAGFLQVGGIAVLWRSSYTGNGLYNGVLNDRF